MTKKAPLSGRNTHLGSTAGCRRCSPALHAPRSWVPPLEAARNSPPRCKEGAFFPAPLTQIALWLQPGIFCRRASGKTHPSCGGRGWEEKRNSRKRRHTDIDMQMYGNWSKKTQSSDHRPYCSLLGYVIGIYVNQMLGKPVTGLKKGCKTSHSHTCSPFTLSP